jgi:DNA invertase Pin-like site-specific DNA recombinase
VISYLRVSTDKQAEDGYGLDVQRTDVAAYAKAHGHKVTAIYLDEGVSGSNGLDGREALPEALLALKAGQGKGLLVPKLDRLSRDMLLQEQLLREVWAMGREVLSCLGSEQSLRDDPDDPGRRMLRQILGAVNEYERSMIVLRLRKGRAAKAAHGGYAYGAPPLGQRVEDRELVPDPAEQAAVARMAELRSAGKSLREIITVLNAEGYRTKRGGQWHPSTVARVLARAG